MNKARREKIDEIRVQLEALRDQIEDVKNAEEEAFGALPESLQGSDRGQESEGAIDILDDAYASVDEAVDYLQGIA